MKKMTAFGVCLAVLSSAAVAKANLSLEIPHVSGEVLLKIRPGRLKEILARRGQLGGVIKSQLNLISGQYLLVKAENTTSVALAHDLKRLPEVAYAEPNYIYHAIDAVETIEGITNFYAQERTSSHSPHDPLYNKLWGLHNSGSNEPDRNGEYSGTAGVMGADIAAESAWELSKGSRRVVVAVIDTGIDYNHPDLINNMWVNSREIPGNGLDDDGNGYIDDIHGWNAITKTGNPMDGNKHGTHCAGTIGAEHNNGIGVAGVMDEVSLMAIKFLSDSGSGSLADAIASIDYATKMNVDIMSNSWGGGGFSQALEDAIKAAKDRGILFVAAAGNDNSNNDVRPSYPATYNVENVISVASHTAQDALSSFSCFGKRTVHVAAPGSNILSTTPKGEYKVLSGTSMATPHVSGVLGLLLSQEGRRLPVLEIRERLMATSVPVSAYQKKTSSGGRVNAYNFLTDTRIPRQGPDDSAWITLPLGDIFETSHPYADSSKITKTYEFPGAKYIKFVVERYDLESGYDFVTIKDGKGEVIEKLTGSGGRYETDYVDTDSVSVEFTSDSSQVKWGVAIREVKVIY